MEPVTCTYCGREIEVAEFSANTGNAYCIDRNIDSCIKTLGRNVGYFDVRDWKATLVLPEPVQA